MAKAEFVDNSKPNVSMVLTHNEAFELRRFLGGTTQQHEEEILGHPSPELDAIYRALKALFA